MQSYNFFFNNEVADRQALYNHCWLLIEKEYDLDNGAPLFGGRLTRHCTLIFGKGVATNTPRGALTELADVLSIEGDLCFYESGGHYAVDFSTADDLHDRLWLERLDEDNLPFDPAHFPLRNRGALRIRGTRTDADCLMMKAVNDAEDWIADYLNDWEGKPGDDPAVDNLRDIYNRLQAGHDARANVVDYWGDD